ncbi:MAG: hypothetical protein PPHEMADM_4634 [uncultured Paraburkholderia sp.]|nr:MAG: hypothetical protein PPHEMADE_4598 [uncultured Paraburkholderia sp.]CAH2939466.1 MAG: hypothetical protein PPHEMADM_4634 [uncultured Paraburkholderia sp.]
MGVAVEMRRRRGKRVWRVPFRARGAMLTRMKSADKFGRRFSQLTRPTSGSCTKPASRRRGTPASPHATMTALRAAAAVARRRAVFPGRHACPHR